MKLVIATSNQGKVKEFEKALEGLDLELLNAANAGVGVFPEETGLSYKENALLKAAHAAKLSGLACLADDSGLEVNALSGAPGIYSARFGGNLASDLDRTTFLLEQIQDVPKKERGAKFACSLVLALPSGEYKSFYGEVAGEILFSPRGHGGFGYDPVFYSFDLKQTFAEATRENKEQISHRGRALQKLKAWLRTDEGKAFFSEL